MPQPVVLRTESIEMLPSRDLGETPFGDVGASSDSVFPPNLAPEATLANVLRRRNLVAPPAPRKPEDEANMYSSEIDPDRFPDGGTKAYIVLFGAFCGLIVDFGIPNGMGAIEAYILAHQLAEYKSSTVGWVFSLHLGLMYFGGVVFGGLFDRYGAKALMTAGSALIFVGLMATAELTELYHFILSFSVVTAIGLLVAMVPLIGVLSHWFLRNRAMACSTATVGGLIGSSLFTIMLQRLFEQVGFRWAMRTLALISGACMLVAIALVRERPAPGPAPELSLIQEEPEEESVVAEKPLGVFLIIDLAPLKDVRFVALVFAVYLAEINSMSILTYYALFALSNNVLNLQAYVLLTVVSVSGIPSRLLTGFVADRYGRFNIMLVTSVFSAIFIWALLYPSNGRLGMLYAFSVLYGCLSSAVLSLIAACLGQICSADQFGRHYGVLYFCLAFLTILGLYALSLVINNLSQHDFRMWIVFEGLLATACVGAWLWARWCNVRFRLCKF